MGDPTPPIIDWTAADAQTAKLIAEEALAAALEASPGRFGLDSRSEKRLTDAVGCELTARLGLVQGLE